MGVTPCDMGVTLCDMGVTLCDMGVRPCDRPSVAYRLSKGVLLVLGSMSLFGLGRVGSVYSASVIDFRCSDFNSTMGSARMMHVAQGDHLA